MDPDASPWDARKHPGVIPCPCTCHDLGVVDDARVASDHWRYPAPDGWLDGCAHEGCE